MVIWAITIWHRPVTYTEYLQIHRFRIRLMFHPLHGEVHPGQITCLVEDVPMKFWMIFPDQNFHKNGGMPSKSHWDGFGHVWTTETGRPSIWRHFWSLSLQGSCFLVSCTISNQFFHQSSSMCILPPGRRGLKLLCAAQERDFLFADNLEPHATRRNLGLGREVGEWLSWLA